MKNDMRIKKILFYLSLSMKLVWFISFLGLFASDLYASFELRGSSSRIHAMGQAYVGLANTPDAIFLNCSGLAQITRPSLSAFYSRPYGIKELNYGSLAIVTPTKIGAFATGMIFFGNEIYQEQSILFSYNRSIRQRFYYGFNLHYMKLQISGYGSDFSLGIDFGFLMNITPRLNWGFFTTNLNRASPGRSGENMPQTFQTGISFIPVDHFILNLDIYKDSLFPLDLRGGFEYTLLQRIAFRSGFSTEPAQFCAGIGFLFSRFIVDYAITTHQSLGLSHHLSLQLQLTSPKR
jgi:hypothetical protein